eukprot:GEMP01026176.1.p1 GENE.GEMP01026176.1~~GEMP01026176.1.p1  ORF type:complete len:728 (+),score=154.77 GEMP01026176.1:56-2239(+)
MAFATARPYEVPAIIKKCRLNKACDASWWQQQLPVVATLAPQMAPPDIANTLWAAAKVPAKKSVAQLFKSFEPHIISQLPLYAPRDLATLAGAYAQASVSSHLVFPDIAAQIGVKAKTTNYEDFEPMDYVKLLHAYAKVRARAPSILSLGSALSPWVSHLYPRDVAGAVWALGHLSADAHIAEPFIQEALSTADKLNVVDVCNLAYGLAKMKSTRYLPAIADIAVPLLPMMEPHNVASLTWALGKARVLPEAFQAHIAREVSTYAVRDVIFVIQGMQAGGASVDTWAAVLPRIVELAPSMSRLDAVHIVPALPKCPDASLCVPVVDALDGLLQARLSPNDGIFVLQACSVLKLRPKCWDPIEKFLLAEFPGKISLAHWILCLSALNKDCDLFHAIVKELEKDRLWTGSFRDIVAMLQIDTIVTHVIWKTAADSFRLQVPKLPLNTQLLQGCIELVKRDYCTKEILGLVVGRLQRLTEPLGAAEIEMVGMLLEEVDLFDLSAWNVLVQSWEKLQPRPAEFLASCAKVHFRPDITLDWVQPVLTFPDLTRLLQVLVKLDYAHLIPWSKWLFCRHDQPLKTMALFLHATSFANGPIPPSVVEAFDALPRTEWDLFSAAQILTALLHWCPCILQLQRPQLKNMVALLGLAEKGAQKRDRLEDSDKGPWQLNQPVVHRVSLSQDRLQNDTQWEKQRDRLHHEVFDALAAVPLRKVLCEVQAGPYALDIVVYM